MRSKRISRPQADLVLKKYIDAGFNCSAVEYIRNGIVKTFVYKEYTLYVRYMNNGWVSFSMSHSNL